MEQELVHNTQEVTTPLDQSIDNSSEPMNMESGQTPQKDSEEPKENVPNEDDEGLRIPLARVKRIIKQDPDVKLIATDSCFLISKATVCF